MKKTLGVLLILMVFIGCSQVVQKVSDNVTYRFLDLDVSITENVQNIFDTLSTGSFDNIAHAKINAKLEINNYNMIPINMDKMEYKIYILDYYLAEGNISDKIEIKSNSNTVVNIPVTVSLYDLMKNNIDIREIKNPEKLVIIGKNYITSSFGNVVISFKVADGKTKITDIEYE